MQLAVHLQSREADVDAIHVGDEVADADEREQMEAGLAEGGAANCVVLQGRR
jgi:hypothetical protein